MSFKIGDHVMLSPTEIFEDVGLDYEDDVITAVKEKETFIIRNVLTGRYGNVYPYDLKSTNKRYNRMVDANSFAGGELVLARITNWKEELGL